MGNKESAQGGADGQDSFDHSTSTITVSPGKVSRDRKERKDKDKKPKKGKIRKDSMNAGSDDRQNHTVDGGQGGGNSVGVMISASVGNGDQMAIMHSPSTRPGKVYHRFYCHDSKSSLMLDIGYLHVCTEKNTYVSFSILDSHVCTANI